jgi:hypothetical protein
MGMGGLLAYTVGIQHGPLLAGLTVLMAIALEGIKPLAVSSALASFRQLALVRGLLLMLLACVAIAYSLTAELSLVAGSRGDLAAKREAAIESHNDRGEVIKAARAELASLPLARTPEEVQAEIQRLLAASPTAGGCRGAAANAYRTVCAKVATLNGEIARARRRTELQQTIAKATDEQTKPAVAVRTADPGAASLATYLATIGLNVPAGKLADWMVLVPVLALELGAALSAVLVQAVSAGHSGEHQLPRQTTPTIDPNVSGRAGAHPAQSQAQLPDTKQPGKPDGDGTKPRGKRRKKPAKGRTPASKRRLGNVVRLVQREGGHLQGGQRDLAKRLKVSKSRVNELLHEAAAAGILKVQTSRQGTSVALTG